MRSWMLCIELFKPPRAVNRLITAGNGAGNDYAAPSASLSNRYR